MYTIKAQVNIGPGQSVVRKVLCKDNTYALAAAKSVIAYFKTAKEASNYWRSNTLPIAPWCWIEGPKGGSYRVTTGARIR